MGLRKSLERSLLIASTCFLVASCSTPQKVVRGLEQLQGCGAAVEFESELERNWKEKRHMIGLLQDGVTLVTLYTSKNGETWTLTLNTQRGIQCAFLAGAYWTNAPAP